MGISLDELILDASESNIAISDGTNTLVVNGDGSIDVNATISATDLDIRDLVFATDKVDVSGSSVTVSATDLDIRNMVFATDKVDVSGSDITSTVSATDLDIRNLLFATDKVDATGSEVSLDAATLAALESVTVSATDLDIRDLTHVSDSMKIGDGVEFLAINADGSLNVNLTDDGIADDAADAGNPLKVGGRAVSGALSAVSASGDRYDLLADLYRRTWVNTSRNVSMLNTAATVTTTAAEVLASPLAGRREVTIQNEGSSSVYIGSSAGVTSANGIKISKNASATFEFGEDINIFMIAASGSQDVRFLQSA